MTYPSRGNRTGLKQKVCYINCAGAVGDADTYRYGFDLGKVILRRDFFCGFREICHIAPPSVQVDETSLGGAVLVFDDHLNAYLGIIG